MCSIIQTKRKYNIEALRVLSMFLVVVGHYIFHGLKQSNITYCITNTWGGVNFFTIEPLYLISSFAVNLFVMISGYFLVDRYSFRWKAIVNLYLQTVFYSALIFLILCLLSDSQMLTLKNIQTIVMPIYTSSYWFITKYIALMIIAPFLAMTVSKLDKKFYRFLLLVLFVISSSLLYGNVYAGGFSILWLSFIFLFAGYIKIYGIHPSIRNNASKLFWGLLLLFIISVSILNFLKNGYNFKLMSQAIDGSVFFLSALCFIIFEKWTPRESRLMHLISKLSPYLLGVYLIHDNRHLRDIIWNHCITTNLYIPIILQCILTCAIIFIICICIDYIRYHIFKIAKIDKFSEFVASKLPKQINKESKPSSKG